MYYYVYDLCTRFCVQLQQLAIAADDTPRLWSVYRYVRIVGFSDAERNPRRRYMEIVLSARNNPYVISSFASGLFENAFTRSVAGARW